VKVGQKCTAIRVVPRIALMQRSSHRRQARQTTVAIRATRRCAYHRAGEQKANSVIEGIASCALRPRGADGTSSSWTPTHACVAPAGFARADPGNAGARGVAVQPWPRSWRTTALKRP
jgi:hypothetical protein